MQPYALANPISLLVEKPREEFTRADLLSVVERKHIERITFHYTAMDGKFKELKIPVANRMQAERILAEGERVDGSSLFKGIVDDALSDLYVIPVYKTAFLSPFDETSLDVICRFLTRDGERAPFAPDNILYKASQLFRQNTGMDFYALGELEFYLVREPGCEIYPGVKQSNYHASAPFMKSGVIMNEMLKYITQICGCVKYGHGEVGYIESVRSDLAEMKGKQAEQLEIEFLSSQIEDAADFLVLSRWLIRNVAHNHGCVATFTPKLEEGMAGTGMHIHMEARKDGKNVMINSDGTLSDVAKRIIGGLCVYADSLTAFGNTVASSYLRLVPHHEAPTRICWGDTNRSAMIRVPLGWSKPLNFAGIFNPQQTEIYQEAISRQTVEIRSPDGSAIIHLLLAGITMAAESGLTSSESLELAKKLYVVGNIFHNKELLDKLTALPKSCVESSGTLLSKRNLYERSNIFPPSIIEYVTKLLQAEKDETMNQYLGALPADDRLHETRKIMHKDLHRH